MTYVFNQRVPDMVVTPSPSAGVGFVMDRSAIGRLYTTAFALSAHEENAGASNSARGPR